MDMERTWKYLLYAFVGLLPLQTVYLLREVFVGGEKWQYGTIAIYGTDILLLLSAIIFLVTPDLIRGPGLLSRFRVKPGMTEKMLMVFVLWAGLSILWAPDQMLAGYFVVKLVLAVGVFLMVKSLDEKESKVVVLLLVLGAALESALGAWQFLAQSTFASTLLGMSAHEAGQAGTSVLKLGDGRWLRAYGTLPHPNILGGFLAAALMLGIGYLARFGKDSMRTVLMSRAELRESDTSLRDRFMDTVWMSGVTLAGAMILLGLLLTFSRSAWLGAIIGIILILFLQKSNIEYRISNIKYKIAGILAVTLIVFSFVLHDQVFPRFDTAVIAAEGSVSERVQSLWDAERVVGEGNMLLGTGAGNFTAEMMRLQPDRPVWSIQPAHNAFVLIFAELGLVGFVLFLLCIVSLLKRVISSAVERSLCEDLDSSTRRLTRNDTKMVYVMVLATLLPSLFLDHWLWTSHFGLFFLFVLLGLTARK